MGSWRHDWPWASGGLAGPCLPGGVAWSGTCNSESNTALSNGQISVMQNPLVAESTVAELLVVGCGK